MNSSHLPEFERYLPMPTLLNKSRPLLFCSGCSHDQVVKALDKAFQRMACQARDVVIVTDIGCSGLFDTFFNTHAFHGLHGRALTYATGLKLARPDLQVVVTMGDGGFGIGGAHFLSACRRNLDITLLVLNNFNFGMTGGQCSPTTPPDAIADSGFLNRIEMPSDICRIAESAGAGYVARLSVYRKSLSEALIRAMQFKGFSVVDLHGICTGRFTRRNKLTPAMLTSSTKKKPSYSGEIPANARMEYGQQYRYEATRQPAASPPVQVDAHLSAPMAGREEILILGGAGQRIVTAGEILCLAGMSAGLHVTRKTDYPVTVLRGHSISEVVMSPEKIAFTGIETPTVIIALSPEGVARKKRLLGHVSGSPVIITGAGISVPVPGHVLSVDFKRLGLKPQDYALAALGILAGQKKCITMDMLHTALSVRFGKKAGNAIALTEKMASI